MAAAIGFIRDGKLVPLAVSSAKRSSALPDVPTTLEAGLADSDYNYWMGMLVPAKTPREIVDRLHHETQKALRLSSVTEKFAPQGIEPMPMTPAEFDTPIKSRRSRSTSRWSRRPGSSSTDRGTTTSAI